MNIHQLKTHPAPFQAIWDGKKTAEFRRNSNFKVMDLLILLEKPPLATTFTGRSIMVNITHLQKGFGMPNGFVLISFRVESKYDPNS